MRRSQRGITFIGWLFLLIPFAIVGYAGIRLVPVYLNYTKIARTLNQIAQEGSGSDTQQNIRYSIEKRLDIEQVEFPDARDFSIKREGQSWLVGVEYEDGAPLLSNIYLTAKFSKSVRLGKDPD
jgi:hypothetical protein